MGMIFYVALGVALGGVWHGTVKSRGALHPLADVALGVLGSTAGAIFAGFFESEQRFFIVWPGGMALAAGFALCALWTARWISRVPVDA